MDAASIIGLWPSVGEFAADLDEAVGTVYVWRHRGAVPQRAVAKVFAAAQRRGFAVELTPDGRIIAPDRQPPVSAPSEDAA